MRKVLTVFSVCAVLALVMSVQAATVNLTVSPSTKTVDVGDNFSLEIWAEVVDFQTGDCWQSGSVGLEFDPTYLQLDSSSVNSQFSIGMFPGGNNNDWSAGYAWFNIGSGGDITSDIRLATLDFTALAAIDPTELSIADFLRDEVNPTKIYKVTPVPNSPPEFTFYNLGGNMPGTIPPGIQTPIGNRGSGEIAVVPEPATMCLLGLGALLVRRKKHA